MVLHVIEHSTMLQVQYVEELRCFWSHLKALQAHWGRKSAAIIDPAQMTISNPRRLYCSMQKRVKSELSTLSKRFHFYSSYHARHTAQICPLSLSSWNSYTLNNKRTEAGGTGGWVLRITAPSSYIQSYIHYICIEYLLITIHSFIHCS